MAAATASASSQACAELNQRISALEAKCQDLVTQTVRAAGEQLRTATAQNAQFASIAEFQRLENEVSRITKDVSHFGRQDHMMRPFYAPSMTTVTAAPVTVTAQPTAGVFKWDALCGGSSASLRNTSPMGLRSASPVCVVAPSQPPANHVWVHQKTSPRPVQQGSWDTGMAGHPGSAPAPIHGVVTPSPREPMADVVADGWSQAFQELKMRNSDIAQPNGSPSARPEATRSMVRRPGSATRGTAQVEGLSTSTTASVFPARTPGHPDIGSGYGFAWTPSQLSARSSSTSRSRVAEMKPVMSNSTNFTRCQSPEQVQRQQTVESTPKTRPFESL